MISSVLNQISDEDYKKKGTHIHSIGAHVRHTLEYLHILLLSDLNEPINYAERKRDLLLETDRSYAMENISSLYPILNKPDQQITLTEDDQSYSSSFKREMLYMHEHIVHHCALLKIELKTIAGLNVEPCFGFAKSTIKHMEINVST